MGGEGREGGRSDEQLKYICLEVLSLGTFS